MERLEMVEIGMDSLGMEKIGVDGEDGGRKVEIEYEWKG